MPPLTRDSWIGITGTALGVVGLAASVYFYLATREVRDLAFAEAGSRTEIISASRISIAPLRVARRDGAQLTGDVTALRFTLWNAGNRVIRADQELEPITVRLADTSAEVLDYRIARVSRPVVAARVTRSLTDSLRALRIEFRVLEPGDGITVQAIYRGAPSVALLASGTYEGVPQLRRESGALTRAAFTAAAVVPLLAAVVLGILTVALADGLSRFAQGWELQVGAGAGALGYRGIRRILYGWAVGCTVALLGAASVASHEIQRSWRITVPASLR